MDYEPSGPFHHHSLPLADCGANQTFRFGRIVEAAFKDGKHPLTAVARHGRQSTGPQVPFGATVWTLLLKSEWRSGIESPLAECGRTKRIAHQCRWTNKSHVVE